VFRNTRITVDAFNIKTSTLSLSSSSSSPSPPAAAATAVAYATTTITTKYHVTDFITKLYSNNWFQVPANLSLDPKANS